MLLQRGHVDAIGLPARASLRSAEPGDGGLFKAVTFCIMPDQRLRLDLCAAAPARNQDCLDPVASSLGEASAMGRYEIGPGEVHCWTFQPARFVADELAPVLSTDERARANRFVFERDRMEFVVCRGVLRHLLSLYGGAPPRDLQFEYSARGKPALASNSGARIQFNVAHSRGAGLIGVTCALPQSST